MLTTSAMTTLLSQIQVIATKYSTFIVYFICQRGHKNLCHMTKSMFKHVVEADGTKYFMQELNDMDKNHNTDDTTKTNEGKMYATISEYNDNCHFLIINPKIIHKQNLIVDLPSKHQIASLLVKGLTTLDNCIKNFVYKSIYLKSPLLNSFFIFSISTLVLYNTKISKISQNYFFVNNLLKVTLFVQMLLHVQYNFSSYIFQS